MKTRKFPKIKENEDAFHKLYRAIASLKSAHEAEKFLQDLCTPAEIQAMADRWLAVYLIKSGKPYRQIYEKTGISVTTVGRVARSIMFGQDGYNLVYERLENKTHEDKIKTKNRHSKKRSPQ